MRSRGFLRIPIGIPVCWSTLWIQGGYARTWAVRRHRGLRRRAPTRLSDWPTLPDGGPTGGFFRDRRAIEWSTGPRLARGKALVEAPRVEVRAGEDIVEEPFDRIPGAEPHRPVHQLDAVFRRMTGHVPHVGVKELRHDVARIQLLAPPCFFERRIAVSRRHQSERQLRMRFGVPGVEIDSVPRLSDGALESSFGSIGPVVEDLPDPHLRQTPTRLKTAARARWRARAASAPAAEMFKGLRVPPAAFHLHARSHVQADVRPAHGRVARAGINLT